MKQRKKKLLGLSLKISFLSIILLNISSLQSIHPITNVSKTILFNFDQQLSKLIIQIPKTREIRSSDNINMYLNSPFVNISVNSNQLENLKTTKDIISFSFTIPINSEYNVSLFYNDKIIYNEIIKVMNQPFLDNYQYTQIFCVGDSFVNRWCRLRRVCLQGSQIIFSFPFNATFEKVFVVPGSKAPPNDIEKNRILSSQISILSQFPTSEFETDPFQVTSQFFNHLMIWHNLMDYVVPTYWTMSSNYACITNNLWDSTDPRYGHIDHSWHILDFSDPTIYGLFYIRYLSSSPIDFLRPKIRCFEQINFGLRKTEKNPILQRRYSSQLTVPYEIDPSGVSGLREYFLDTINVTGNKLPNIKNPLIIIIKRKGSSLKRSIINIENVSNSIRELCPFCDVRIVDMQERNKVGQVSLVHNASLLVGMHGSGLTHGIWLKPSTEKLPTGIYEIFPYRYTCRKWYNHLANMARIQYFAYYTKDVNHSKIDPNIPQSRINDCILGEENMCERIKCHDVIRDQSSIIDIEEFKRIIFPFFQQINESRKNVDL